VGLTENHLKLSTTASEVNFSFQIYLIVSFIYLSMSEKIMKGLTAYKKKLGF
jgi:hypothetical protein